MFDDFSTFDLTVTGDGESVPIHGVRGGEGPPVLLLHGFPQTHALWHRIGPELARTHTVVCTDLRGYGDSGRAAERDDHAGYSFRAMAADQVAVMAELGHDEFTVIGHDRGARVAHRMTLDHPSAVRRAGVLDIMPTSYVYSHVDRRLATAYYHWFFYLQPAPLPERLISGDPVAYLHSLLGGWGSGMDAHPPQALAAYERAFADEGVRHAMLEDYRAAVSVDLGLDAASEEAGVRVSCPLLVLWGGAGVVGGGEDDPLDVWRSRAADPALVQGRALEGAGHFLVDERPDETLDEIRRFLGA